MAHDNEMLKEYLVEAQENLAELESALLSLEQSPQSRTTLDACFRHAHTIKGASGYMGFSRTNTLTHAMENIFDALRKGTVSHSGRLMNVLFQAYDRLANLVEEVALPEGETSDTTDVLELLRSIMEKKDELMQEAAQTGNSDVAVASQESSPEFSESPPVSEVLSSMPESLADDDQELIEIYREEIKSLFNQVSEAVTLDIDSAKKIVADMKRVTNYVGYDNIMTQLNVFEQELDALWQDADGEKARKDLMCERLFRIFEPVTGGLLVYSQDVAAPSDSAGTFEDDPELYGIFVDFIKENMAPLQTIPDMPDEEWIVGCQNSLEQIRSSAHYMDYMDIVALISEWEERLTESLTSMQNRGVFDPEPMRNMWKRLGALVPEIVQSQAGGMENVSQDAELLQDFASASFGDALDSSMDQSFLSIEETVSKQPSEGLAEQTPSEADLLQAFASSSFDDALDKSMEQSLLATEEYVTKQEVMEKEPGEAGEDSLGMAMDGLFDQHTQSIAPSLEISAQFEEEKIAPQKFLEPVRPQPARQELEPKPKLSPEPSAASQTVRLELEKVEGLLSEVSEMVVLRSALGHLSEDLRDVYSGLRTHHVSLAALKPLKEVITKVGEHTASMSRVVQNMQDTVMRMRMLPVRQLFDRYPRVVRDLSVKLGKQVSLVMEGEETGLDKRVMEQMADPMLHLIRNAVDHGCEMPDVRKSLGKPERATILLSAAQEGGQVVIRIRDDGKGLDRGAIIKKASAAGLLKEIDAQKMSDERIWELIFLPGISTAETVSDTSGRGVGMDVVRRNVEKIGGTISVQSHPGWGAEISIRIPLTLAIIKALLVKVGRQTMAIPLNAVQETLRLKKGETSQIEGFEVFSLRQDTVPLIRLAKIFKGTGAEQDAEKLFVVLVRHGDIDAGLSVDKLIGQQEVVIKPLAEYLTDQPGFAGATILGDGSIAFIVDIPVVLSRAKDFIRTSQRVMERKVISLDIGF